MPEWAGKEEEERAGRGLGRHSVVLGIGWDEWREGVEQNVTNLMQREVKKRQESKLKR